MALSDRTKYALKVGLAVAGAGEEVATALDREAAVVEAISSSNLVGVDGTGSNAAPLAGTETRLDALETKVNAILTSLKAAGLMASS